jgi:hypothetical protein
MKPAKFAASIAIYAFTLVWVFRHLPEHGRTRSVVGGVTALVMLLEMAIIVGQAARGKPSHFNASTPFDSALFTIMGAAIVSQTLASVAVAVALWRTPFEERALGWALRLGLVITIVGALLGGVMASPTHDQIEALKAGVVTPMGAHTVGAPDGGPGIAVTGWSSTHGDLRVAHFMGLHALQALPLLAFGLRRWQRSESARIRLILVAAASYASLVGILASQALRARSLVAPDATTLGMLAAWLVLTLAAANRSLGARPRARGHTAAPIPTMGRPPRAPGAEAMVRR